MLGLALSMVSCGAGVDPAPGIALGTLTIDAGSHTLAVKQPAPSSCPATWPEVEPLCNWSSGRAPPCNVNAVCVYPGAGDCFSNGLCADAVASCSASVDAGMAWSCGR